MSLLKGRPRLPPAFKKTKIISIRVSEVDFDSIAKQSKSRGFNDLTSFVRAQIFAGLRLHDRKNN